MSQFQEPNLRTPEGPTGARRLASGLTELVRSLVASGFFLVRPTVSKLVIPRTGTVVSSLRWGDLNRFLLTGATTAQLPRVEPKYIGVPLYVAKLSDASALTLTPSGLSGERKVRPLVNGATSLTVTLGGLYTFITDGQDWFAGKGV